MIYADETFHILEINPRVSGATSLGIIASGVNTFVCLVDILLGHWEERLRSISFDRHIGMQLPTLPIDTPTRQMVSEGLDVIRSNVFHVDGDEHPNMLIRLLPEELEGLPSRLAELNATNPFLAAETLAEIVAVTEKLKGRIRVASGVA